MSQMHAVRESAKPAKITPRTASPSQWKAFLTGKTAPRIAAVAILIIGLVATEIGSRLGIISPLIIPAPSAIWAALADGFSTGAYYPHLKSTLIATIVGFTLSAVVSVILAGILTSVAFLERMIMPYIVALQNLPKIAIAPIIILWVGFGIDGKIIIVAITAFFPMLINSLQGLRVRSKDQFELFQSLGASRYEIFKMYRMPYALPYIFAGLHVSIVFALIGAIVAEYIGSTSGLGYLLLAERGFFNVPGVFAILVILIVIGLILRFIILGLERHFAGWSIVQSN